MSQKSV